MGLPSQPPQSPARPSLAGRWHAQAWPAGAPFQPLLWGSHFPSCAGPGRLPTPSQALPASTSDAAKRRVQSLGEGARYIHKKAWRDSSKGSLLGGHLSRLQLQAGSLHPRMMWSYLVTARAATSALPLGSRGKGSCSVSRPPAAPQENISLCR